MDAEDGMNQLKGAPGERFRGFDSVSFGSAVILQTDGTHRIDNSRDEMTTNARGPSKYILTNCYTLKQG